MKTTITLLVLSLLIVGSSVLCLADASEQVLYTFSGTIDGGNPYAELIRDGDGNLYGTTVYGGMYGYGTVFELSPGSNGQWVETVLHSFNFDGQDGMGPSSSLLRDSAGNLYGTTNYGGAYGLGTVFMVMPTPNGWSEKVLHSFNADGIAYNFYSNLISDPDGNLFGTTYYGGTGSSGTVFELSPNPDGNWREMIIYNFDYIHGGAPSGGLVSDRNGKLYGTTEYGGEFQHGTAFELKHLKNGNWQETVLHSFNPGSGDGFQPHSGLVIDRGNRLYGTTLYGGSTFASGAVFELQRVKGVWQENVIHSFGQVNDGFNPYGHLAIDSDGRLYGTTFQSIVNNIGGAGIVYQLSRTKQGWQERILHQFDSPGDGGNPYSGVVLDRAGSIFGTTSAGGEIGPLGGGTGVVFEVTLSSLDEEMD